MPNRIKGTGNVYAPGEVIHEKRDAELIHRKDISIILVLIILGLFIL